MNKRLLALGGLACAVAVPSVVTLANGASDAGTPGVPAPAAAQLAGTQAEKLVGPNARSFAGADGVTRVEGKDQVCSVARDRILACGPNDNALGQAPIVDVSIAADGGLAVSFLSSKDVGSIAVTDSNGGRQAVALVAGIGQTSLPKGDFKIAWKTADGQAHTDRVPAAKMFAPAKEVAAAGGEMTR